MSQSRNNPASSLVATSADHESRPPIRVEPDHHLWRNGRLWWIAFTVHLPGWQKDRIRRSLGTADIEDARRRRDEMLVEWTRTQGVSLSIRIAPRRRHCAAGRPDRSDPGLDLKC